MEGIKKLFASKTVVVGLFATLTLFLAIPLTVLLSQEQQDIRQRADSGSDGESEGNGNNSRTALIAGYVFIDNNKNGKRDIEEKPYPQAVIKVVETNKDNDDNAGSIVRSDIKADTYGFFSSSLTIDKPKKSRYSVQVTLPAGYKATSSNPIAFSGRETPGILEFAIASTAATTTASVSTAPLPSVKPSLSIRPSCAPRPACLDSVPRCLIAEPTGGWCPRTTATVVPTKPFVFPTRQATPTPTIKPAGTTSTSNSNNSGPSRQGD